MEIGERLFGMPMSIKNQSLANVFLTEQRLGIGRLVGMIFFSEYRAGLLFANNENNN